MTRHRKTIYVDDDEKPRPSASFNWGNIVNLTAIPAITAVVILIGQWALTGDTVKRHDKAIDAIVVSRDEEKKSRENMRDQFMASQGKLIEVLGKLDTRLSVSEKQQESAGRQIDKITDILQRTPSRSK